MPDMINGKLKVLKKLSEYEFAVELDIMRDGKNNNNWSYENIEECYLTFLGQPILCAYVGDKVGDGHNMEMKYDEKGQPYYSFTDGTSERIVGVLSEKPSDFQIVKKGTFAWIKAKGKLFRFYNKELVDQITKWGEMDLSAETEVYKNQFDEETGIDHFLEWTGLGVTILGKGVAPAIPGARIEALKALSEEFNSIKLRAASFNNNPSDNGISKNNKTENADDNKKGVCKLNKFSKAQLAELQAKFEGYTVLAAAKDDNGIHICLMSTNGETALYTMGSIDDVVVADKIQKVNAQTEFVFSEDCKIAVDSCELTEDFAAKNVKANEELAKANADLETANNTIKNMQEEENARRLEVAKKTATETLEKFNENRETKVNASVIEELNKSIEAGDFTACQNKDGKWNGEELVKEKVLAACANEVMNLDKENARKNNSCFAWEKFGAGNEEQTSGGVDALLKRNGVR